MHFGPALPLSGVQPMRLILVPPQGAQLLPCVHRAVRDLPGQDRVHAGPGPGRPAHAGAAAHLRRAPAVRGEGDSCVPILPSWAQARGKSCPCSCQTVLALVPVSCWLWNSCSPLMALHFFPGVLEVWDCQHSSEPPVSAFSGVRVELNGDLWFLGILPCEWLKCWFSSKLLPTCLRNKTCRCYGLFLSFV